VKETKEAAKFGTPTSINTINTTSTPSSSRKFRILTPSSSKSRTTTPTHKSIDDPELVLLDSFVERSTPQKSTTDFEVAKLMANISNMADGPRKAALIKKTRSDQRKKLGIEKKTVFKSVAKTLTPLRFNHSKLPKPS